MREPRHSAFVKRLSRDMSMARGHLKEYAAHRPLADEAFEMGRLNEVAPDVHRIGSDETPFAAHKLSQFL